MESEINPDLYFLAAKLELAAAHIKLSGTPRPGITEAQLKEYIEAALTLCESSLKDLGAIVNELKDFKKELHEE